MERNAFVDLERNYQKLKEILVNYANFFQIDRQYWVRNELTTAVRTVMMN